MPDISDADPTKHQDSTGEPPDASESQAIFDDKSKKFEKLMTPFGEACESNGIQSAFAFAVDPANPAEPIIFMRGQQYEVAAILARVLRQLRNDIIRDITP